MYYLPEPPIALLFFGFFIGVTCGLAFEAALKQQVNKWGKQGRKGIKVNMAEISILKLPFLGICVGICVFLAAGLEIFTYNRVLSYTISGSLTILIAALIWTQLKKLIVLLLEGGSQALDLDAFY
ncbi:MAG: hypothetical protein GW795_14580 [Cyanobacteria bacterium]|uniref:hypothetical protein n=1 Tax=Geminocystis sp. TaxID=2664100 RepID=UPI001DA24D69|nr:hypothetical protein [Cyanobacteria bacterium CG_2015-16_32_12]NCO79564.1 hypothetical protein [Cyanobacteria bacterium CG_2015-22_32_23]NCQ05773.1 hypothetical protein [Cyanobacteria bacterium CG_2015-09_32_10]NCQ43055.1 hypothetical protein [Cyanobacteria bacterium CG_2015-04_32_10]NCS84357.1 hypothetical protein [Cyanobacteria bacterium CG_2015-02_32_10]